MTATQAAQPPTATQAQPTSTPTSETTTETKSTTENGDNIKTTESSPFDFPGMLGSSTGVDPPAPDLLGTPGGGPGGTPNQPSIGQLPTGGGNGGVPTSEPGNGQINMMNQIMGNQMGQMTNQMGIPISQATNLNNATPTTKSHLAEILGKAEMHQLTSMSRALEPNQTPNGPTGQQQQQPGQPPLMPGQGGPPRPTQQPGKF